MTRMVTSKGIPKRVALRWKPVCCIHADHARVTDRDREYMTRALQLAARGKGKTFPNPAVGCVIVKEGQVIGEGYHPMAGKPHAEVYALRAAGAIIRQGAMQRIPSSCHSGQGAQDATAYVTLEPCSHYGLTPPCSRALVQSKISKVVVGIVDPNPLVSGQGLKILEDAGIDVVAGCLQSECYSMNQDFMERMSAADK